MSESVRTCSGVPKPEWFASKTGTPLMIDLDTGYLYYLHQNTVKRCFPESVQQGYGSLLVNTTRAFTIGAGWTRIINYDTSGTPNPVGVLQNLVAGTLGITEVSAYAISVMLTFSFTDVNAGREFSVRMFNVTDNVPVTQGSLVYVGRNQDGISWSVGFPAEQVGLTAGLFSVGKEYAVEVGGSPDTFDAVQLHSAVFAVNRIGN